MTTEELLKMRVGESIWDEDIQLDIVRVPGGWVYYIWDSNMDIRVAPGTYVPERRIKDENS